jgi:hypothetical protein
MFVPPNSPSSIVQGAALFSRNPKVIPERAMKLTIGVGVRLHFNPDLHSAFEHLKIKVDDGNYRLDDGFDAFVRQDQIYSLESLLYYISAVMGCFHGNLITLLSIVAPIVEQHHQRFREFSLDFSATNIVDYFDLYFAS